MLGEESVETILSRLRISSNSTLSHRSLFAIRLNPHRFKPPCKHHHSPSACPQLLALLSTRLLPLPLLQTISLLLYTPTLKLSSVESPSHPPSSRFKQARNPAPEPVSTLDRHDIYKRGYGCQARFSHIYIYIDKPSSHPLFTPFSSSSYSTSHFRLYFILFFSLSNQHFI